MPSQNFTIDNVSPLISYTPAGQWRPGSASSDNLANKYSDGGTFIVTDTAGSKATFSFNGTDIYIFGAKRDNHGKYTVSLDGGSSNEFDGYSKDAIFQVPLYTAGSLDASKMHTVVITCEEDYYMDIDFITWTAKIGKDTEPPQTTIQDTNSDFEYSGTWTTSSDDIPSLSEFKGGTAHQTRDSDSYVTLNFTGQAIDLFGGVGPQRGPYTVQLDGGEEQTFNATNDNVGVQIMLYHADNLGGGEHSLRVANAPANTGDGLVVDYAVYYQADDDDSGSGSDSSGISTGAIVGIVVAVVVGLAVAALVAFFVRRRKKKANREEGVWSDKAPSIHGASPQPYMYSQAPSGSQSALPTSPSQYPGSVPSQYGGQPPSTYGGQPPSQYGGQAYDTRSYAAPSLAQGQPPVGGAPTSQTGSSSNIYNPWSDNQSNSDGTSSGHRPGASQSFTQGAAPGPLYAVNHDGEQPAPARRGKQMGAAVPAAQAQAPPSNLSPEELAHQRMLVEGREQDFGPLPPNYDQATQPFSQ
ncbi:hypothetical protein EV715DRAFT_289397 [Schizophyllum commune]